MPKFHAITETRPPSLALTRVVRPFQIPIAISGGAQLGAFERSPNDERVGTPIGDIETSTKTNRLYQVSMTLCNRLIGEKDLSQMRRINVGVLLLSFWAGMTCSSVRTRSETVRAQLQREYALIVASFKKDDPSAWIDHLAPDFRLVLFNGSVQNRGWAVSYVRDNRQSFHIVELNIAINELTAGGDSAVATVEQTSKRTFQDSAGTHTLDVGAIQLETWRRGNHGEWLLVRVQEKDVLYIRRDGK